MARRSYGNSAGFGFKPPKKPSTPRKYTNTGGGVAYNPNTKVPAAAGPGGMTIGGLLQPPVGSYDPALEAQRRAAQRGLHDTLQDVTTERHFGEVDLNQALRDIRTSTARRRQKLGIDYSRSSERIGNEEADTRQKAQRTSEDFTTKLADIGRQFSELGQRQGEASNAAGVNDAGTSAAAAAARARNQAISEAPIHTAQGRLQQDLYTALSRLGGARGQLEQDRGIAGSQLKQDRDRDRMLSRRDFGRSDVGWKRKEGRARREGAISDIDILEQEIYQARQEHPGAFSLKGRKKGRR